MQTPFKKQNIIFKVLTILAIISFIPFFLSIFELLPYNNQWFYLRFTYLFLAYPMYIVLYKNNIKRKNNNHTI